MEDVTTVRYWFPSSWNATSRFLMHDLRNVYSSDVEVKQTTFVWHHLLFHAYLLSICIYPALEVTLIPRIRRW